MAVSCANITQAANSRYIQHVYTPSDNAGYQDVVVRFVGAESSPGSDYKQAAWQSVGATGAYGPGTDSDPRAVSPYTVVNNVTMYVDLGATTGQQYITPNACGTGAVLGNATLTMTGGYSEFVFGGALAHGDTIPEGGYFVENEIPEKGIPYSRGDVTLNICESARVGSVRGGMNTSGYSADTKPIGTFSHQGNITINVYDNARVSNDIRGGGGSYCCVDGDVSVNVYGDATVGGNVYGGARNGIDGASTYVNNTSVTVSGNAHVSGDVYGGGSYDGHASMVKGNTKVTITGGTIDKNVYGGGNQDIVNGNSLVVLEGGTVTGEVYGSGKDNTTKGTATVQILGGDWSNTEIYGKTDGATVEGGTELIVGAEGVAYNGELASISGFDRVTVAKGSELNLQSGNLFDVAEHSYTITSANMGTEGSAVTTVSPDGEVKVVKPITLNFNTEGRVISGRYKIIDASEADSANVDTTTNWDSKNVTVNGQGASFEGLVWDGNVLYLDYVSPAADAVMAGNWGVFKASQAFTGTLWGNRANACVLNKTAAPAAVTTDEKGNTIATAAPAPKGVTLAWGTAYGQSARISGVGADYSIYGGAIGLEHHFVSGRSLGAALGYDWGTVSPFGSSDIDQETLHAAVYGRAGIWQLGANSAVAVDWSAAYGDTTSESDLVDGDWTQESLQLDARVSYLRKLNDRTTGSVFAGVQYFAADSDTVDGLEVSSMQNLRAEIGAGISYKLNQKATVYGEASVYNDVMRHNPCVDDSDVCIKGSNPGRTGGTLSVGAQYDLNDDWSVRGGYSFDVAEDSTEHNFNAGAVYKF